MQLYTSPIIQCMIQIQKLNPTLKHDQTCYIQQDSYDARHSKTGFLNAGAFSMLVLLLNTHWKCQHQ